MFPLLAVEYRNYTEKNGFEEVILPHKVGIKKERTGHPLSVSFVFINEVYIRFKSVSLMELGSKTTSNSYRFLYSTTKVITLHYNYLRK